jgi:hypothetical protein
MTEEAWKPITSGSGLLLAVDFEATGRPEASFLDLAPMLEPAREVWAARPPVSHGLTASGYLDHWSSGLPGRVEAVLGFCAGASFAAALAERLAATQDTPPALVVLDPERPTTATLRKQFEQAMRGMNGIATDDQIAWAKEEAARADGDLAGTGELLAKAYGEIGEVAFERIGLKPGFRAELVDSFRSLMEYLVAAADAYPRNGWSTGTAIVSATPLCPPGAAAELVSVGADHADLLRDRETARAVSAALTRA